MELSDEIKKKLELAGIDIPLTEKILTGYNNGSYSHFLPVKVSTIPEINNEEIVDLRGSIEYPIKKKRLEEICHNYNLPYKYDSQETVLLTRSDLTEIGYRLFPLYSCGILNGGASTSYVDSKKNESFHPGVARSYKKKFKQAQKLCRNRPKGITPGFYDDSGNAGPSFLKLKILGLYHAAKKARDTGVQLSRTPCLFQMTSQQSDSQIAKEISTFQNDKDILTLAQEINCNLIEEIPTAVQPLISAFSVDIKKNDKKEIFLDSKGLPIALPGGHGQSFLILKDIFRRLYNDGKRFISIGNIDNNGYTFDPVELAILALSGKEAGFDFSFKTAIDTKGGILIIDQQGKLNCVDLGVGIEKESIIEYEKKGIPILFNCASGLFSLEHLLKKIDVIIETLPLRFSNQDKDRGIYSQAEQVTWEVLGVLDDFLIFAVEKFDRFLASKLLLENFLTSGVLFDTPFKPQTIADQNLINYCKQLQTALKEKLKESYGIE